MHDGFKFEEYWVPKPEFLELEIPFAEPEILNFVSVKHAGNLQIDYKDEIESFRILSRDPQGKWNVARLEKDRLSANFQGNPLWPALVLEPFKNLMEYFSLVNSSNEFFCLLPATSTINSKLLLLFGSECFRFQKVVLYSVGSRYQITDQVYVDSFIDSRILPMAEDEDRDSVHDWSYHFLTFLFYEFLENVRLNLKVVREHLAYFQGPTRYAWNYYGHTLNTNGQMQGFSVKESMPYVDAIYRQMAVSLDVSTAKLVQLLLMQQKGFTDRCKNEKEWCERFFSGVNYLSIQSLLPFEFDLEKKIPLPSLLGYQIEGDLLTYCDTKLTYLNQQCSALLDPQKSSYRQQIFSQALSKNRSAQN